MEDLVSRLEKCVQKLELIGSGSHGHSHHESAEFVQPLIDLIQEFEVIIEAAKKIHADVATCCELFKEGLLAMKDFLLMTTKLKKPSNEKLAEFLAPVSAKISEIQKIEGKSKAMNFINHLKSVNAMASGLMWMVAPSKPALYIKEMSDSGQFYTNRVLKDFKGKESQHTDFVHGLVEFFKKLEQFIDDYFPAGLIWNPSGADASTAKPSPASTSTQAPSKTTSAAPTANLFAQISKGTGVTSGLKKVDDSQKTHKNPDLRGTSTVPGTSAKTAASAAKPSQGTTTAAKPAVFELQNKKWAVEYQTGGKTLEIENADMSNTVYVCHCVDTTVVIKAKINSITMETCRNCNIIMKKGIISSFDMINSKKCAIQADDPVPSITLGGCDDIQVYLSERSLESDIITSKTSGINVLQMKENGDVKELYIPEQYTTKIVKGKLVTTPVEHA